MRIIYCVAKFDTQILRDGSSSPEAHSTKPKILRNAITLYPSYLVKAVYKHHVC